MLAPISQPAVCTVTSEAPQPSTSPRHPHYAQTLPPSVSSVSLSTSVSPCISLSVSISVFLGLSTHCLSPSFALVPPTHHSHLLGPFIRPCNWPAHQHRPAPCRPHLFVILALPSERPSSIPPKPSSSLSHHWPLSLNSVFLRLKVSPAVCVVCTCSM